MTISDEACAAAASAFIDCGSIVAALEAAAPFIRAEALEDAKAAAWAAGYAAGMAKAMARARDTAERGGE